MTARRAVASISTFALALSLWAAPARHTGGNLFNNFNRVFSVRVFVSNKNNVGVATGKSPHDWPF